MTRREIEKRLAEFRLRLERLSAPRLVESPDGNWHAGWIIIGSGMAKDVTPLRGLADAEDAIDWLDILASLDKSTAKEQS